MFGPYDNFNLEDGHVIPGLINKIYHAKSKRYTRFRTSINSMRTLPDISLLIKSLLQDVNRLVVTCAFFGCITIIINRFFQKKESLLLCGEQANLDDSLSIHWYGIHLVQIHKPLSSHVTSYHFLSGKNPTTLTHAIIFFRT